MAKYITIRKILWTKWIELGYYFGQDMYNTNLKKDINVVYKEPYRYISFKTLTIMFTTMVISDKHIPGKIQYSEDC